MDSFAPVIRLTSVDFPAFGMPTTATKPHRELTSGLDPVVTPPAPAKVPAPQSVPPPACCPPYPIQRNCPPRRSPQTPAHAAVRHATPPRSPVARDRAPA